METRVSMDPLWTPDPLNRVQILIQPFIIRSVSKFLNVSESQFPNRERYEVYEVVTT